MFKSSVDDFGGIKYSVRDIEHEREIARKKEKMLQLFRKMDRNQDSYITMNEWIGFLTKRVSLRLTIEFTIR